LRRCAVEVDMELILMLELPLLAMPFRNFHYS